MNGPEGAVLGSAQPVRAAGSETDAEEMSEQLLDLAGAVQLLGLDVDGVLTNGQLLFLDSGEAGKSFHVRDGQGLRDLMAAGVQVALVSGRQSRAVELRARDLGIAELHQGVRDKGAVWLALQARLGIASHQCAFMGDDLPDLPALRNSGLSACPADAVDEVLAEVRFVSSKPGGAGAVRDLCDLLLRARSVR